VVVVVGSSMHGVDSHVFAEALVCTGAGTMPMTIAVLAHALSIERICETDRNLFFSRANLGVDARLESPRS
jgi:hypothetical protein